MKPIINNSACTLLAVISYMELGWPGNRTFKWNVISLGKRLVVLRAQYCHIFSENLASFSSTLDKDFLTVAIEFAIQK
jgi:hypothetical protein